MKTRPIRYAVGECTLGSVLVATSERGVCAVLLGENEHALATELASLFPGASLVTSSELQPLLRKAAALAESPADGFDVPLDTGGTGFQQRVWHALQAIPAGTTISYTELAARVGKPDAVRAVAGACAANRLAIAIPCHRVVRSDGALSGYRWGVERKRALLQRERA